MKTRIDADRDCARRLVVKLHAAAEGYRPVTPDLLAEAACLIDGYQAGLALATPHPLTGYRMVKAEAH